MCMYMYDVLVEIWGGGGGAREGLKVSNKHEEGESTSPASDRILWDKVCIQAGTFLSLDDDEIVAVDSTVILRLIH